MDAIDVATDRGAGRRGLDALVATTTENLYYVTGFRSISHALFRGLELYAVFTRRGAAWSSRSSTPPASPPTGSPVDQLACYGKFFFEYADDPGGRAARCASDPRPGGEPRRSAGRRARRPRRARPARGPRRRQPLPGRPGSARGAAGGTTLVPAYQFSGAPAWSRARGGAPPREGRADRRGRRGRGARHAQAGVTEREAAHGYEQEVLRRGAQPFFTVVTIGERAALADV